MKLAMYLRIYTQYYDIIDLHSWLGSNKAPFEMVYQLLSLEDPFRSEITRSGFDIHILVLPHGRK